MVAGKPWQEFLAERPIAVIATAGSDGTPHAVPVEVLVRDATVWVWCESVSVKARNAAREGRAALVAYKGSDGVLVRGPVRILHDGDDGYAEIVKGFLEKYPREPHPNDTLIGITPTRVSVMS
jgi:predicted pyridoxine 5'-phosphate oxidase superfamily flavin-nucleotide-binding protein